MNISFMFKNYEINNLNFHTCRLMENCLLYKSQMPKIRNSWHRYLLKSTNFIQIAVAYKNFKLSYHRVDMDNNLLIGNTKKYDLLVWHQKFSSQ